MNLNLTVFNSIKLSPRILVASLFLFLAISLEILMSVYWYYVLNPRLLLEAESNAKIVAESQAKIISNALSSRSQTITQNDIDELSDQVLVFIDPELKRPYFLGISLELDDDVIESETSSLDLSEGDMSCKHCFPVISALYSKNSDELLGLANFMVSDVFYEKLKNDVKQILMLESLIGLIVLFLVWMAVNFLINKLNFEILSRKQMTQELQYAKEMAEKASQTKSDFLANMSHEIRTPLNAIIGMTYILLKTPINQNQHDLLGKLDSASHLLLNLISDLLDFSKIEAGKLELESTTFKMDEVLNNLSELIMTKAGEKGLDILYHTSQDIPQYLVGDPMRLGQVLLNLLNNSVKFTENGHVLLSIKEAKQQCNDSVFEAGEKNICLQFSITDTGIGIKPKDINKLFNSFTQADNSTTRKFGGTGLGLSICKQLIQQMGGDIKVESSYGQGSTFSFSANFGIDLESRSEAELKANTFTLPAHVQQTHVLVVDDNEIAQTIFQQMFENFGFRVSVSSNAQAGIDLLKHYSNSDPIKLVLMEWKMPGMDGIEATQFIKQQLSLDVIPKIILVTAHANQHFNMIQNVEWDDYLIKPISQSILYDSVISTLSEQQIVNTSTKELYVARNSIIEKSAISPHYNLSHKQILLTEDNMTNQEVALTLLRELQFQVSIANNGKEAVEAIKTTHFDLILMDLQMPEMDGFEATRLIRQDKNYQQVPIIAMTAHAMQEDRQKCLNAQMDDYLTKPIDVDKFFAILNKWLGVKEINSVFNKKSIITNELPELQSVDLEKALLRVRGKKELLLRLLINFKNQKRNMAEEIAAALLHKNLPLAKELVHSLKGESATLEANSLFLATKNLELQLLQNNVNKQKQKEFLDEVTQLLKNVIQDIIVFEQKMKQQQKMAGVNITTKTDLGSASIKLQFQELAVLLKDNNLRAKTLAQTMSPTVLSSSLYSEQWGDLLNALSELDFEAALKYLQTIAIDLKIAM